MCVCVCVCIPSLLSLPPHLSPHHTPLGHHRVPRLAPCAIKQLPTSYLTDDSAYVCVCINIYIYIYTLPFEAPSQPPAPFYPSKSSQNSQAGLPGLYSKFPLAIYFTHVTL